MAPEVEPFTIAVPDSDVADLRARLAATRWPDREPVDDWSQGVPLAVLTEWCQAWAQHDWARTQRRLNLLPQVTTVVDGLRLHAVHARSQRADATPLVLTHGWPGSFLEFEDVVAPLTAPPADQPAFHVVLPSLPGYGFSERPRTTGWDVHRIARAWVELMARLGYERFVAAGSDWGTSVSTCIALQQPAHLLALHLVPPLAAPQRTGDLTADEQDALRALDERTTTGSGYTEVHRTRPQTIGYALNDSPAGLAAWLGEKLWLWADRDHGGLRLEQILDDLSLYWFTGTAASSARLYWQSIAEVARWFTSETVDTVAVPTGCSVFPAEVPRPSRRWAQRRFTNVVHWGEPDRGGHFAAWEQPELFARELRALRRALP